MAFIIVCAGSYGTTERRAGRTGMVNKYAGKRYSVDTVDCTVMSQCYAAIAENLPDFKGMHLMADIGNGTMNVMILNNGKASESKSWTVKLEANERYMMICNLILDRKAEELPALFGMYMAQMQAFSLSVPMGHIQWHKAV